MERPKQTKQITIQVTPEEYKQIRNEAVENGTVIPEVVKDLMRQNLLKLMEKSFEMEDVQKRKDKYSYYSGQARSLNRYNHFDAEIYETYFGNHIG